MRVFVFWLSGHALCQVMLTCAQSDAWSFETALTIHGFFMFWFALWGGVLHLCSVSALADEWEVSRSSALATLLFTLNNWLMGALVFIARRLHDLEQYVRLGTLFQLGVLACVLLVMEYYVVRQQQLKGLAVAAEKAIEEEKRVREQPDSKKED